MSFLLLRLAGLPIRGLDRLRGHVGNPMTGLLSGPFPDGWIQKDGKKEQGYI